MEERLKFIAQLDGEKMAVLCRAFGKERRSRIPDNPMLADRRYCYPLAITDCASRYIFTCEALACGLEGRPIRPSTDGEGCSRPHRR
jgi:hypothetical protein